MCLGSLNELIFTSQIWQKQISPQCFCRPTECYTLKNFFLLSQLSTPDLLPPCRFDLYPSVLILSFRILSINFFIFAAPPLNDKSQRIEWVGYGEPTNCCLKDSSY